MIIKRGRTWWLDIWVGHGKTRKRVRRSLHTDERTLALARAQEVAAELERGRSAGGVALADFKERYLAWALQTKPASYRSEKSRANHLVAWMQKHGALCLGDITPYLVEQFRADVCSQDRRSKKDKPAKRSTANRYCALLRTMINRARDWEIFNGPNPLSKVKFYRESEKARPLTEEDVSVVLKAAAQISEKPESPAQTVFADFLIFLFNTGLRLHEALRIRWQDFHDALVDVLGKGERRRSVPLNAEAIAAIGRQRKTSAFIFDIPNRDQYDLFRRTVAKIRKLSGVAHFHLHLTRHYFISGLLAAGVDIQTIAEIVGQTRLSTTLLYAHSTPERRRAAVRKIKVRHKIETQHVGRAKTK